MIFFETLLSIVSISKGSAAAKTIASTSLSPSIKLFGKLTMLFFLSLLILCLGSALTDWDARSVWLFHAKRIYIDNDLYGGFDNYMPELMNAYPLIAPSLSATLAKLIGHWNEIFPKSTNILLVLPAVLIQCFFLKDSKFKLMWLMFILLFSGRILINGRTDGLVAIYFVSCCLVIFKLFII